MPGAARPLPRRFFTRPPEIVAPDLIGHWIMRRRGSRESRAQIVETEAYLGVNDPAAHARHGLTRRNAVLFGEPGHAYIYQIYGMHLCLNVSAHVPGVAGGVLFRAAGDFSGPGRLTRGLAIAMPLNGCDLTAHGPLFLARGDLGAACIAVTPRVGIRNGREFPLRFYWEGHPAVTRPRGPVLERRRGLG
ncbi:MAG: DNA-3-methyladenine glycosylase [Terriglobales bacterium]